MKVKNTGRAGSTKATSGAKAAKAVTKAKAVHTPVAAKAKKASDNFGGSTKAKADKPAAQLPRSGWASTEEFKKAARASRDLAGLAAGGVQDRPVIRPLYGIVFPLPIDPKLKDAHLEKAAKDMLGDRKITLTEVNNLIAIAKENGVVSKQEKKDLKRLMDNAGSMFEMDALRTLQGFVKDVKPTPDPVIRPLYGVVFPIPLPDLKNQPLDAFIKTALGDRHITLGEINDLIKIANENGGLTKTERADLEKVYDQAGKYMDADAKFKLGQAIGREPVIRPLYGIVFPIPLPDLKSSSLKDLAKEVLGDRHVTKSEVEDLIGAAMKNGGLSKTERADLNKLLDEVGDKFDADAKTRLSGFLKGDDGLKITTARRDHIVGALEKAEGAGKMQWANGFPLGTRMVEVPLKHENHPDGYTYTALIPVGALAPGAKEVDPNTVNNAWIRRSGGLAGMTQYAHLDF
jgi:hypothetical protein